MAFLIGTDEAGYGPNLGPLVVAATVWQVPDAALHADLYDSLQAAVAREPSRQDAARLAIADSKSLYGSGGSLADLEAGVWAALATLGQSPTTWQQIWPVVDPTCVESVAAAVWFRDFDEPLPVDLPLTRLATCQQRLTEKLAANNVRICRVQSRVVFPEQFNALVDQHGNKASALSAVTLELVRELTQSLGDEPILIHCDKHGGRNHYAALLQHFFSDHFIEVRREGRDESVYRWGPASRRVEIRFVAKGESFLPSALASMLAKYLRELSMRAFNQFWCARVADLRPTAGYPVDAARFRRQIAAVQQQLTIPDRTLWRNR